MRTRWRTVAAAAMTAVLSVAMAGPAAQAADRESSARYRNPVLPANAADPSVIRAQDGYYYLYTSATHVGRDTGRQHLMRSGDPAT